MFADAHISSYGAVSVLVDIGKRFSIKLSYSLHS